MQINYPLLVIAACAVLSTLVTIDFIIYCFKKAPKSATFNLITWRIGFFCLAILIYYILNDKKF